MPEQRVAVLPGTNVEIDKVPEWVRYPETDGEPMPDGCYQRDTLYSILHALKAHLKGRDVYFGVDMFIYYREGREPKAVAPDVFAVVGVPMGKDRVYRPSKHGGRLPDFVMEVLSPETLEHDLTKKKDLYRQLGVDEYFLFDSEAGPGDRAMWAYELDGGGYAPMLPVGMVSGEEEYASRMLGLGFRRDGERVRVRNLDTGLDYAWPEEDHRDASEGWIEAERRAEAEQRERAEAKQRKRAEAENRLLRHQIADLEAKLRTKP